MAPRSRQRALRFVRALVACLTLWIAAGAPAATPGWGDPIALVARSGVTYASVTRAPIAAGRRPIAAPRAARPSRTSSRPAAPVLVAAEKPTGTTDTLVLIPRRYLRNLALLS